MSSAADEGARALCDGDAWRARTLLQTACAAEPLAPAPRFNLAVALRQLGQLGAARRAAQFALALGAPAASTHCLLGIVAELDDDPPSAQSAYRRALEADPSSRVAHVYLGLLRARQGDRTEALAHLARALADGPAPPLPRLVHSRVALQHAALSRTTGLTAARSLCAVAPITEVMLDGGIDTPAAPARLPTLAAQPGPPLSVASLADRIDAARRVVVLSGAGVSQASGLPTRKALWTLYNRDSAVSVARFQREPRALWEAARGFAGPRDPEPNAAHLALAAIPQVTSVVTQNIDGLHQRADAAVRGTRGPVEVLELHGSFARARCHACGSLAEASAWALLRAASVDVPRCRRCNGALRPDVVLFGEPVLRATLEAAVARVSACDLLLVVGCAMDVAPASELPLVALEAGASVVEINRAPSRLGALLGLAVCPGDAAETLPAVYARLAARRGWPARGFPAPAAATTLDAGRQGVPVQSSLVAETAPRLRMWRVADGARVARGEVVAEVESDKVDVDVEAPCAGVLVHLVPVDGPADQAIARIVPDAGVDAFGPSETTRRAEDAATQPSLPWPGPARARLLEGLSPWVHLPWLRPDPGLAALDPDALQWLEDRADEHAAALGDALPTLRLRVFRSVREAAAACASAWAQPEAARPWDRALRAARWKLAEAERTRFGGDAFASNTRRTEVEAVIAAVWAAALGRLPWPRTRPRPELALPDCLRDMAIRAALEAVPRADTPLRPCPWEPLAAMWMRGAWPFALPPDTLGVWVPVWREGSLVVDPDAPERASEVLGVAAAVSLRAAADSTLARALPAPGIRG